MEKPTLTIEFPPFQTDADTPDKVLKQIADLRDEFSESINLILIPYFGLETQLSLFHRGSSFSRTKALQLISELNSAKQSVMVPLNGGVTLPPDHPFSDPLFSFDRRFIEALSAISVKHSVENYVTVTPDQVRAYIKKYFSNLKVIASCVKFVGGEKGKFKGVAEYANAFQDYDSVVALNQHASFDFLKQFEADAKKMILLLNLDCASADLYTCYLKHYCSFQGAFLNDRWPAVGREVFDFIPRQFAVGPGKMRICQSCDGTGRLENRKQDLERFISMGVNKFKFPRSVKENEEAMLKFIATFISLKQKEPSNS